MKDVFVNKAHALIKKITNLKTVIRNAGKDILEKSMRITFQGRHCIVFLIETDFVSSRRFTRQKS